MTTGMHHCTHLPDMHRCCAAAAAPPPPNTIAYTQINWRISQLVDFGAAGAAAQAVGNSFTTGI